MKFFYWLQPNSDNDSMKRIILVTFGLLILAGGLGLREWLVREEIDSTQNQLRTQLNEMVKSASSRERLNEISKSSFVFDKFVSPVLEATNRLLLPSARLSSLLDWTQTVHQEISQSENFQRESMKAEYQKEVEDLRAKQSPSIDRMIQIAKKAEDLNPDAKLSEIASEEMKALKEFGQKRDDTSLALVKEEGLKRLQQLRKILKKADHKHMGQYLSSGKFVHEIQQPAIELILQIRQEEIRKTAWKEFRSKLNDILAKRSIQLSNAEHVKKRKEIEKLFDEPMAKLFEQEEPPFAPNSDVIAPPPPSAAVAPLEQDLYNERELSNPADANQN